MTQKIIPLPGREGIEGRGKPNLSIPTLALPHQEAVS